MFESLLKMYQETQMDFSECVILILLYKKDHEKLEIIRNKNTIGYEFILKFLEVSGYIKLHGHDTIKDITVRTPGDELVRKYLPKEERIRADIDPTQWIDGWRELFPAGVNESGYRYRGNRLDCLRKMIKFVATYEYTREEIFEATRRYIKRFELRGYKYMKLAHYFIDKKDAGSSLASECELLREEPDKPKESEYGRTVV